MIDTLKIRIHLDTPLEQSIYDIAESSSTGRLTGFYKILHADKMQIAIPVASHSASISAQVSLPALMRGHNSDCLSLKETFQAMDCFLANIQQVLKLPDPPSIEECQVSWADYVHDWIVDSPEAYLAIVERFAMARGNHSLMVWKNGQDKGTTVKVGSKNQMLMVYNKESQVNFKSKFGVVSDDEIQASKGRLRAELRLRDRGWESYFGSASPTLKELQTHLRCQGRRPLSQRWDRLTDGWDDCPMESAIIHLNQAFSARKARRVAETLSLIRTMGVQKYRQSCKPDDATFSRFRADLRQAGVSLADSGGLPRLSIPWFDDYEVPPFISTGDLLQVGGQGDV